MSNKQTFHNNYVLVVEGLLILKGTFHIKMTTFRLGGKTIRDILLKGYDYGSFTYFNIVKYKLLNKIEKQ